MYHYITVPGHPSDKKKFIVHLPNRCTITLQFRGIHPTDIMIYEVQNNGTITLQFRGIHPTEPAVDLGGFNGVPLHYSSGASIRPLPCLQVFLRYHYITVPGHPSDRGGSRFDYHFLYHYITVPGHPSDCCWRRRSNLGTITLQFRGIHPTPFHL